MRDFKRKILFFLLLAMMLAGASAVCSPDHINLTKRVEGRDQCIAGILSETEDSVDVLILGDSLSIANISPMELWKEQGITSYVCGQSGQRATESYYLLKQALKTQTPRLVILETNIFSGMRVFFQKRKIRWLRSCIIISLFSVFIIYGSHFPETKVLF